jgi:hypothetical protein
LIAEAQDGVIEPTRQRIEQRVDAGQQIAAVEALGDQLGLEPVGLVAGGWGSKAWSQARVGVGGGVARPGEGPGSAWGVG